MEAHEEEAVEEAVEEAEAEEHEEAEAVFHIPTEGQNSTMQE